MSLLLISALTIAGPVQSACSWDRPGLNPFMGDVVAAVDRYQDIPPEVRARLKQRMAQRRFDELVTIRRNSMAGAYDYTDLRDMHFGMGTVCRAVTRDRWSDTMEERGLVYCEEQHCLIVPTVCRNLSRVTRLQRKQARTEAPPPPARRLDVPFTASAEPPELQFEAPSAGASPSFASVVQDIPIVPLTTGSPGSTSRPPGSPRFEARDGSWMGFAGLPLPVALPLFGSSDGLHRSLLQSPPVVSSSFAPVPGIAPPLSQPPTPTVIPPSPPVVVVTVPTVPPMTETPASGEAAPVPGVTPAAPLGAPPAAEPAVPNLPGDSEPVTTVGVPGVPPASGPREVPVPRDPGDPGAESTVPTAVVPEPGTVLLMGLGLALVVWMSRRSRTGRNPRA